MILVAAFGSAAAALVQPLDAVGGADALRRSALTHAAASQQRYRDRYQFAPRCCICINCKWVNRCRTYHWVEEMHEQPHVADAPDFDPNDPQIQVFIRKEGVESVDVKDHADDGTTQGMRAAVLSTEYDVFECDDFVEDSGKWLRLMPDADFIPT